MPYHCCWGKCHSNSSRTSADIRFLPFPKPWIDLDRAKRWLHLCGREDFTLDNITKNTYICSLHFNVAGELSLDWKVNKSLEPVSARSGKAVSQRRILNRDGVGPDSPAIQVETELVLKKKSDPKTYTREFRKKSRFVFIPTKPRHPPETSFIDLPLNLNSLLCIHNDDKDEQVEEPFNDDLDQDSSKHGMDALDVQECHAKMMSVEENVAEKKMLNEKSEKTSKKKAEQKSWDLEMEMLQMENKILQEENKLLREDNNLLKEEKISWEKELNATKCQHRALKRQQEEMKKTSKIQEFVNIIFGDKEKFKFFTGITVDVFKIIMSLLGSSVNELKIWSGQQEPKQRSVRFSPECQFVLTLIRLRQGVSLRYLSHQFDIGYDLLRRLFITWIQLLYKSFDETLRPHMYAPRSRHHPLPHAFRNSLLNKTRIVLDCTEIRTETSRHYTQQGHLYSQYKSHATAKILIGCAPNGACMFVSSAFEGSISDKSIVEKSGVLTNIVEGDQVLTCSTVFLVILSPYFLLIVILFLELDFTLKGWHWINFVFQYLQLENLNSRVIIF